MTVIIRGLDKPAECVGCRFCLKDHGRDYCVFDGEYIDWADGTINLDCPLVEVPVPHGRLIDADILAWIVKGTGELKRMMGADPSFKASNIVDAIHEATTVIEAEENHE